MDEIHLTKKDFVLDWYSGSGAGGQHRNKHRNCCRITHIATGISAIGAESRERSANQRAAFARLANRIVPLLVGRKDKERFKANSVIRNYHEPRNEVFDKASGLRQPYREVVTAGNLGEMIEARRKVMQAEAF